MYELCEERARCYKIDLQFCSAALNTQMQPNSEQTEFYRTSSTYGDISYNLEKPYVRLATANPPVNDSGTPKNRLESDIFHHRHLSQGQTQAQAQAHTQAHTQAALLVKQLTRRLTRRLSTPKCRFLTQSHLQSLKCRSKGKIACTLRALTLTLKVSGRNERAMKCAKRNGYRT